MFPCVILKDCALEISKCQAICGSVICMERTRGGWLIQREGELLEEIRTGDPAGCMGLSCFLVLPQAFGAIYLGETFCCYVSVGNHSSYKVRDVVIKENANRTAAVSTFRHFKITNWIHKSRRTLWLHIEHDIKRIWSPYAGLYGRVHWFRWWAKAASSVFQICGG